MFERLDARAATAERHPAAAFAVLAVALSTTVWTAGYLLDGNELTALSVLPGGFGPLLAAVVVAWAAGDLPALRARCTHVRVSPRYYALALAVPLTVAVLVNAALAATTVPLDPGRLPARLGTFPFAVLALSLVGGGNEEPGWRGFMLPVLQRDYSALTASLLVGVVWAGWHLPLFLLGAPRSATGQFLPYLVIVLAFSVLLTHVYRSSGGSVPVAALTHGAFNAMSLLVLVPPARAGAFAATVEYVTVGATVLVALAVVARYGPALSARDTQPPREAPQAPIPDGAE